MGKAAISGDESHTDEGNVGDDELLYRAVKHGLKRIEWRDGQLKTTTDAFLDPSYQISVDRASKCAHDASHSQVETTDYICCLQTRAVRAIGTVTRISDGQAADIRVVDVRADPLLKRIPPNAAHALIYTKPELILKKDRKLFSRLKESLAQIATWEPNFAPFEPN